MRPRTECGFEAQVLAAVIEARWPEAADTELREHVSQCSLCSEVANLAGAFALARGHSQREAPVPDASRVWWMAQLRARREATQEAARPILAAHLAACAWAIGLLVACIGGLLAWVQSLSGWLEAIFAFASVLLASHGALVAVAAAFVIAIPTAAYFTLSRE